MDDKWDIRFLELAKHVSMWSLDPSTKTGAVITEGKRIISLGYNGLPQGIEDTDERLNDRELKYKIIVHCERNAMIFANRSLEGCTLYTWPFMSCATCASMMIQAGIIRIVAPYSENPRWIKDFELTTEIFKEAGVEMTLMMPDELISLGLIQEVLPTKEFPPIYYPPNNVKIEKEPTAYSRPIQWLKDKGLL